MDERDLLADALRGQPHAPAGRRLPHARLGQRGRRRRPGGVAAPQPRRPGERREPRRLADDRRRARLPRHAALAQRAARGAARRARARADRRAATTAPTPSTRRCSPTRSGSRCSSCSRRCRPAERLAFVLHDMFARAVRRDRADRRTARPTAARQLASRARRRVRGAAPAPDADLAAPARGRRRVPRRRARRRLRRAARGARPRRRAPRRPRRAPASSGRSAARRRSPARRSRSRGSRALARPALVNGAAGVRRARDGPPCRVAGFTVADGRIVEIDVLADPARLRALDLHRARRLSVRSPHGADAA